MAFISPRMLLKIWNSLTDAYDHEQLAENFRKIDMHDHAEGRGTPIGTAGIQDGAITLNKIYPGAVSASVIADDSITGAKLEDGSVTAPKLAASAVTTVKLEDFAVTTTKLGDLAVTTGKVNNLAITSGKLADSAAVTDKINNLAVTTAKINDSAVTTAKVNDGAITIAKLGGVGGKLLGVIPLSTYLVGANGVNTLGSFSATVQRGTTVSALMYHSATSAGGATAFWGFQSLLDAAAQGFGSYGSQGWSPGTSGMIANTWSWSGLSAGSHSFGIQVENGNTSSSVTSGANTLGFLMVFEAY